MVQTLSVFKQPNFGMHYPKKLEKLPLLMFSNVLSRDGMELAVNAICVNEFASLEPFYLFIIMFNFILHLRT